MRGSKPRVRHGTRHSPPPHEMSVGVHPRGAPRGLLLLNGIKYILSKRSSRITFALFAVICIIRDYSPMKFELPLLPYSYDALEPYIDAKTMEIHHTKHHASYVTKLNEAVAAVPELERKTLEELLLSTEKLPEPTRTAVRNHGGGHYNHSLFWTSMGPHFERNEKGPSGNLKQTIEAAFGDFEKFKGAFSKTAAGIFGSGWVWLVKNDSGALSVITTPNQNAPLTATQKPIVGLDVWEHAYYLKYQNRRPEYIENWWHVVNWEEVEKRY